MPTKLQGIDLSQHNGATSAPLNVDFALIRIGYGLASGVCEIDAMAETHLERLKIGKPRVLVAYWYLATSEGAASGEDQAAAFLARVAELETRFGPLGRACDSEPLRDKDGAGNRIPWDPPERVYDRVVGFATVASNARPCLMYGSREWWARLVLPWWFPMHCPFWAASQGAPPAPWKETTIQQWPEPVSGVDHDTFPGSQAELREVFGLPVLPSPA